MVCGPDVGIEREPLSTRMSPNPQINAIQPLYKSTIAYAYTYRNFFVEGHRLEEKEEEGWLKVISKVLLPFYYHYYDTLLHYCYYYFYCSSSD